MMKLTFDQNGYLIPYEVIQCDLDTLEKYFVKAFPLSRTREQLWQHYLNFIADIRNDITPTFTQWLDGSFFTQEQNPQDIDLVTFVDVRIFHEKEHLLDQYWSFSLETKGLDAYWVEVYSGETEDFEQITQHYRAVWQRRFGADREENPKGFIEIAF